MSSSESDSEHTKIESVKMSDLIKMRGVVKGKLTLFKKFLTKLGQVPLTAEQIIDLELRVARITEVFKEFENIQDQIETLCTDVDQQLSEREMFENTYFQSVSLSKGYLKRSSSLTQQPVMDGQARESTQATCEFIKYPDISLPSFNGVITNWIEFRDTFDALINQTNLKPIQKFKYLKSCLTDNALEVISSLEYAEESHSIAWQLLCERYNNPRILVYNHLRALFNVDTVASTATCLRTLSDNISKHLRTLRSINVSTEGWDLLVIFFLSTKLEKTMQRRWEEKMNSRELPTLQEFKTFLRAQADLQEALSHATPAQPEHHAGPSHKALVTTSSPTQTNKVIPKHTTFSSKRNQCPNCKEGHYINQCPRFLALSAASRIRVVRKLGICSNCLGTNHILPNCRASNCKTCRGKHHTLLHISHSETTLPQTEPKPLTFQSYQPSNVPTSEPQSVNLLTNQRESNMILGQLDGNDNQIKQIILSTAQVKVLDINNQIHTFKILLDSGSQSNFITEKAYNKLKLPIRKINMEVLGFNDNVTNINQLCEVTLQSRDDSFTTNLSCFIVPNICKLPSYTATIRHFNIPRRFILADDTFYQGGDIDMIIGAEQFYQLLCIGQYRLGDGLPILQRTRLGWVVSGVFNTRTLSQGVRCNFIRNKNNNELNQFWAAEKCYTREQFPHDDILQCEKIFNEHERNSDGNFVVTIPLKEQITALGPSRSVAYNRFKSLESKFARDPQYKEKYVNFMRDFIKAGHMIEYRDTEPCNFLPHHAVINLNKTTTPLRVVMDASFQTCTGKSLNDIQYKGNINQDDLFDILLRFRKNRFVVNADIERMYRMIYINPNQQKLQCILWREHPTDPLRAYALTTLSFGLKCAPYIATRCLLQLANENKNRFSDASDAIVHNFYMDDLLYGGDDEQTVAQTAVNIDRILRQANFYLRKWKSNSPLIQKIVSNSTNSQTDIPPTTFGNDTQKVLGLAWSSSSDKLMYTLKIEPLPNTLTKRKVLSLASAIFDPLGLLGPVIIFAKCFIQRLWKIKSDWDETLSTELSNEWESFYRKLFMLNSVQIPRHALIANYITLELHGFSDSSLTAYGATIYTRSIDKYGKIVTRLLCAKSRLARNETIPRLELRAACLLTTLYNKVNNAFKCRFEKTFFWCDSMVVLTWIKSQQPTKYNCFVKNRVTEINSVTNTEDWHWISTKENPADLLSRGLPADKIAGSALWWEGPSWLSKPVNEWPSRSCSPTQNLPNNELIIDKLCSVCMNVNVQPNEFIANLLQRWSSLTKLINCLGFVYRFIHNCRNRINKLHGPLSVHEINGTLNNLIKFSQIESYPTEYQLLKNNKQLPKSSNLLSLNPFIDESLIKVGGRLSLSHFDHNKKHPIILPHNHQLTLLIMQNEHVRLLHAGPQLLLSSIRERFWPIHGKSLANKVFKKCVTCFRANPRTQAPIMGNLPTMRVTPAPPFLATSVDYAGPFIIRDRRGRGYKTSKCFIALFICMTTKAVHIELITGLQTSAFLSAFRRFMSRRGKPKEMFSDNGTTFHGACNEITELYKFLNESSNELLTSCAREGISWKFLPAYTPHMGSLHESAIKSCKYHLKRVLGKALLTYEEFSTILVQVEGILNSRPLCPIPNSNNDEILALTPAHFLIGRTPISMPDYDYADTPTNHLTLYQQLQQLQQDFWRRWSRDYIGLLQERTKWRSSSGQGLRVGSVVLVKDDRLPTSQWPLGRVVGCCPGRDGVTRVAEIDTAKGVIKRAFNNICPLPNNVIN